MDTNSMGMSGGDLQAMRTVFSLLFVIGGMLVAYFLLRKRISSSGSMKRRMRVVERLPLDARRSLMLVEVDGQELVVGVAGEQISTLKELPGVQELMDE